MNQDNNLQPIDLTRPADSLPSNPYPPKATFNDTVGYFVTSVIFFALGFLVAYFMGVGGSSDTSDLSSTEIAQGIQGTFVALTPPPTPLPTVAPVELTYSPQDYSLGDTDAPVKLVEFSDYQCPYCAFFVYETLYPLMNHYEGYVEFIYRDHIIFGEMSARAAHAAKCADEQEHFWDYHDQLFVRQQVGTSERVSIDEPMLTSIATDLDLDMDSFNECLDDDRILQEINATAAETDYFLGGQAGTPNFLMNGQRFVGFYSVQDLIPIIDEELEKLGIDPPA